MQPFLQRYRVFFLHVSFWCVYLSFFFYQISSRPGPGNDPGFFYTLGRTALHVSFNMIAAYMNYFIFLPRFLKNRNPGRYFLEFVVPFILLVIARVHLQRFVVDGYTHQEHYFYSTIFIVQIAATSLFVVIFIALLKFAEGWFEFEARKKEVENEKLMAELNFLKAQINPHFLFNTLNNLYYLAYSKSENTTEVIAKLSQMMRYMIYDSNYPQVPLSKEIEYMQNYISLEKLRLNNQVPIHFTIEGNTETALITPLIFITFLENAFKHGVTNNATGAWIIVSIRLEGNECVYKVENSKITKTKSDADGKSGIGLRNVQRRLELSYPGKYTLKVEDKPDRYSVQLNIHVA